MVKYNGLLVSQDPLFSMTLQPNLSSRQRTVTVRGSLQASRAFTTLLCNAMRTSISTIISSNFSSNSFFRNWMSLTRWSEQQKKKQVHLCTVVFATSSHLMLSSYSPSRLLSSFCMRLQALSVSKITLKHSALKSSERFLITSIFIRLGPPPCWGLRSGTDIVLHWWSVTDSIGR